MAYYYGLHSQLNSKDLNTQGKNSVSRNMVKPLSIIVPVLFVCVVFVLLLPFLNRAAQTQMQVSVTALSSTSILAAAGESAIADVYSAPASAPDLLVDHVQYPGLGEFSSALINGRYQDVVGVYVRDIMALPVQQQPAGRPDYVADQHNLLTQFAMPKEYGSVGLLAHNYLSGSRFTQLTEGMEIVIVYGNGHIQRYQVDRIETFQALKPNSPFSDFIDLADPTGQVMTSAALFKRMYTTSNHLIFQTCIEANGEPSWGRMFIIATPLDPIQLNVPELDSLSNLN